MLYFRFSFLSVKKPLIETSYLRFYLRWGGGSGHEPFAIGYIGKGGLTASVIGDVFAAPSSIAINNAIKACYPKQNGNSDVDEGAGVLLIVTNYTGKYFKFLLEIV